MRWRIVARTQGEDAECLMAAMEGAEEEGKPQAVAEEWEEEPGSGLESAGFTALPAVVYADCGGSTAVSARLTLPAAAMILEALRVGSLSLSSLNRSNSSSSSLSCRCCLASSFCRF